MKYSGGDHVNLIDINFDNKIQKNSANLEHITPQTISHNGSANFL